MSTHTQATSTTVRSAIVVEAPIERAFRVFTEEFDRVKPREHGWPLYLQRFGGLIAGSA